jgi:hypothetical protein
VEPPVVVDGLGGGIGPVEVAGEHRGAAEPQLTVVGEVGDHHRGRLADAAGPLVEVGVEEHRAASDLGGAVRHRRPRTREPRLQRVDEIERDE